jgi:hypothetical protein
VYLSGQCLAVLAEAYWCLGAKQGRAFVRTPPPGGGVSKPVIKSPPHLSANQWESILYNTCLRWYDRRGLMIRGKYGAVIGLKTP